MHVEGKKVNLVIQGRREVLPFKSLQHLVGLFPQVVVGTGKKTARAVGSTTHWERSGSPNPSAAHQAQIHRISRTSVLGSNLREGQVSSVLSFPASPSKQCQEEAENTQAMKKVEESGRRIK